jgi:hypothetical protein
LIWSCTHEDCSVASGDCASTLTFERLGDHGCATTPAASHDLIYERDEVVGQAQSNLYAHTNMVPKR